MLNINKINFFNQIFQILFLNYILENNLKYRNIAPSLTEKAISYVEGINTTKNYIFTNGILILCLHYITILGYYFEFYINYYNYNILKNFPMN